MGVVGLFLTATAVWGSTWLAIKYQLGVVAPEWSVAYRFALAAILLAIWCAATGRSLRFPARDHRYLAALGAMLFKEGIARAQPDNLAPDGQPHFAPKAKSVIWIFLCGGVSHVESFDVKPELDRYAGQTIDNTPYRDVLRPDRLRDVVAANPAHGSHPTRCDHPFACRPDPG